MCEGAPGEGWEIRQQGDTLPWALVPKGHLNEYPVEKAPVARGLGEVMDMTPVVGELGELDGLQALCNTLVVEVYAAKSQPLGALYDGAGGAIQREVTVVAIARAELSAKEDTLAVLAVPNEH
eukprot:CAMPEP_0196594796 /NCGR_PEP_ID=MMETSP1081-20130531/79305_1 /TAXON_ID=36882 /ORGANISM="Pyramimonas amylifera, Strain CCMP720" /LENGTH=122 /DNA_ID=CAMNT_0041919151 /DNA_START=562 /DNA_END=931 /DNA_ORIENTATION=-